MTNGEKIDLLEEMLELKSGTISENTALAEISVWDSMAALSLIALCDEHFGIQLTGEDIVKFRTVKDILDIMVG